VFSRKLQESRPLSRRLQLMRRVVSLQLIHDRDRGCGQRPVVSANVGLISCAEMGR
jgi:hypothetical protein